LIGTGGSIFRIEAIKDVEGFDINIKGAGEDLELAYRIKNKGWKLCNTTYEFFDVPESGTGWKVDWKSLWTYCYWYGYNYYYVYKKHPKIFKLYSKIIPIFSFVEGLRYFLKAFKLTKMKESFLLPLFFIFRQLAWTHSFIKAYFGH
jgi:GT2 family glycosyltransferase